MVKEIVIYTTQVCPYCNMAKRLFERKGISQWTEINAGASREVWQEMQERTGRRTVPQIFIGEVHVGGYDDLSALDRAGKLDALLGIETITIDSVT
ncbi:MAG: glutaredoxin 3 [Thiotrichales bacterium]|nr:glutaredoxin 3 [Thiotrichales bacterium]